MADESFELLSNKRARLCSPSFSDDEYKSSHISSRSEQDNAEITRCSTAEKHLSEKTGSELSREQDGGQVSRSEKLENNDFPSCFSVENSTEDSEEHHYQPIAGEVTKCYRRMRRHIVYLF